jgi:hypothetical protein
VAEVRDELRAEVTRDQRAYALAMEGAEQDESKVLASVLALEKKWGRYDLDWATADPAALAETIAAFEVERERREALISFAEYRASLGPPAADAPASSEGPSLGGRTVPLLTAAALLLVAVLIVAWLLR